MGIEPRDERLHTPGSGKAWQESYYFNWSDPAQDLFGLARIGLRPNERRADGIVLTIRAGRAEFLYPGVGLKLPGWSTLDPARGLRCGALSFTMEEPLRRYRLTLEGRNEMDLVFEACNDAYDYHPDSPVAARHFEQFGRVRGYTCFHGDSRSIDGFGERDKSWGERDWARVEGWNWLTAQFGDDLAFNVFDILDRERPQLGGFVFRNGRNHTVRDYTVEWTPGRRAHVPAGARIHIEDDDGGVLDVVASVSGRFPLYRGRAWIEEAKAEFRAVFEGKERVGHGVLEHVHRPDLASRLRHGHEIVHGLSKALWP